MGQRWQVRGQEGGSLLWEGMSPTPKNEVVQGVLTSKVGTEGDEDPDQTACVTGSKSHHSETGRLGATCDPVSGGWTCDERQWGDLHNLNGVCG